MYYAREDQIAAATKIQAAYRGYIVRRTQPLKHLRTIRNVRIELNRLETQLARDPQLFEILRRDPAERLKWSEGGMALLLQLDSMQGVHPVVRENRKSLTREVISYQEYIDSAGKGQKDVTNGRGEVRTGSGQHGGHTQAHLPYVQTAHGQQGMDSSSGKAHGVPPHIPSVQPGAQSLNHAPTQGHIPYVQTGLHHSHLAPYSPSGLPSAYSQHPSPVLQGLGHAPYDARFPPGTEADIIDLFGRADLDGSGSIDGKELSTLLSLQLLNFSRRTILLMLHLFADTTTESSRVGPAGFAKLWRELKKWQRVFQSFDNDGSGTINLPELREAMLSLGLGVTPRVLQLLLFNYDRTGRNVSIVFGDFVECGLIVKGLTEKFVALDPQYTGSAEIDYQTFMMLVLPFIVA